MALQMNGGDIFSGNALTEKECEKYNKSQCMRKEEKGNEAGLIRTN